MTLISRKQSVLVIDENVGSSASLVAGGMFHPMVFKQLTTCWLGLEGLKAGYEYYTSLEKLLNQKFYKHQKMLRVFGSDYERTQWEHLANTAEFSDLIESPLATIPSGVIAPHGAAFVKKAGFVDTLIYLRAIQAYLKQIGAWRTEKFFPEKLQFNDQIICYDSVTAEYLIYANGHAASHMKELQSAFSVTMGDDLLVEMNNLDNILINGGVYVIPRGNSLFRVGSTYFRYPYTQSEEDGRNQILGKLRKIIDAEIKVIDHQRAFRPNIKDRRPLIGPLNSHRRIYSFNGMGSKGVLHAPLLASHLADHLMDGTALMKEILPSRFQT